MTPQEQIIAYVLEHSTEEIVVRRAEIIRTVAEIAETPASRSDLLKLAADLERIDDAQRELALVFSKGR